MGYPEYQSDLDQVYESEVIGEVVSSVAARLTRSSERREKWLRLHDLETQTKDRLIEFLEANQQHANLSSFVRVKGWFYGLLVGLLPWSVSMKSLEGATAPLLEVFQRLEGNAAESSKGFFSYVVAHERAIAEFARRERAGQSEKSIEPIVDLLT